MRRHQLPLVWGRKKMSTAKAWPQKPLNCPKFGSNGTNCPKVSFSLKQNQMSITPGQRPHRQSVHIRLALQLSAWNSVPLYCAVHKSGESAHSPEFSLRIHAFFLRLLCNAEYFYSLLLSNKLWNMTEELLMHFALCKDLTSFLGLFGAALS